LIVDGPQSSKAATAAKGMSMLQQQLDSPMQNNGALAFGALAM